MWICGGRHYDNKPCKYCDWGGKHFTAGSNKNPQPPDLEALPVYIVAFSVFLLLTLIHTLL